MKKRTQLTKRELKNLLLAKSKLEFIEQEYFAIFESSIMPNVAEDRIKRRRLFNIQFAIDSISDTLKYIA